MLIVRNINQPISILHSKEGVQQGDPLAMILYGISLTPLIEKLKKETNDPTLNIKTLQTWYADDAAIVDTPTRTAKIITTLQKYGPSFGYYVQPEKSLHICSEQDEIISKQIFSNQNIALKYVRGHSYLGGFIGEEQLKNEWLQPKITQWLQSIKAISKTAELYPQSAYASFTHCIQPQWYHLCRLTNNIDHLLQPIEDEITNTLIPSLFQLPNIDHKLRTLLSLPVKYGGMNIQNPITIAKAANEASINSTSYLVSSLLEKSNFDFSIHTNTVKKEKIASKTNQNLQHELTLLQLKENQSKTTCDKLERNCDTGTWLTTIPVALNGTALTKEEFQDNIRIRYDILPFNLPEKCDGCNKTFTVNHAINCKNGGLINLRHTEIANEWAHLCQIVFTKAAIIDSPDIYPETTKPNIPTNPQSSQKNHSTHKAFKNAQGDKGVIGFWKQGRMTIFDIRVVDPSNKSYTNQTSTNTLNQMEQRKKTKYLTPCNNNRRHFTPLVFSTDGKPGKDTLIAMQHLANLLSIKLTLPYSQAMFLIRSRMSIALARCNTLLLRTPRIKINNPDHYHPIIKDGAAITAFTVIKELFD